MVKPVFIKLFGLLLIFYCLNLPASDNLYLLHNGSSKTWVVSRIVINNYLYKEPLHGKCALGKEYIFNSDGSFVADTSCNRHIFCPPVPYSVVGEKLRFNGKEFNLVYLTADTLVLEDNFHINIKDTNVVVTTHNPSRQIIFTVK